MKFCPECGNKLIDGAKFCPECGYKIANLNNVSNIRDVHIEEGYKNSDNSIKISSDEYIKKILRESDFTNIDITPNISEKISKCFCKHSSKYGPQYINSTN